MIRTALALSFSVIAFAGCSSAEKVGLMEAPPALSGDVLNQVAGKRFAARRTMELRKDHKDAEGHFARKGRKVPGRRPVQRHRPPRADHGFGFDRDLPSWDERRKRLTTLLDKRPTLKVPGRLACVEVRGRREFVDVPSWGERSITYAPAGWTVRPANRSVLTTVRAALGLAKLPPSDEDAEADWPAVGPKAAPFASIVSIPSMFLPGQGDLGKVRYAAARVGAEAILVFARSTRVYTFNNGLANLYPLLFPVGFLLPAKQQVAVTRVEGAIVSVRTGDVFCVALGESRIEERGSVLLRNAEDTRQLVEKAERLATKKMTGDLARELAALEAGGRLVTRKRPGATK